MNPVGLISVGALTTGIVVVFVLGAAPVFAVRLIARIYPKGDERRSELVAEAAHVKGLAKTFELWRWLGESFALAVCEGVPRRRASRKRSRGRGAKSVTASVSSSWTRDSSFLIQWEEEGQDRRSYVQIDLPEPVPPRSMSTDFVLRVAHVEFPSIPMNARVEPLTQMTRIRRFGGLRLRRPT